MNAPLITAGIDVQADGSLTNQRVFVMLPSGGGDGMTIDSQGRLYITAGPALHVASPDGKLLGSIPSPVSLITAAFAGKDKKTIYAVTSIRNAEGMQRAEVYSIPMIAQGFAGRAK
jgi:gluconolactonase